MNIDYVLIGEVVSTQGIKGEIRVLPHTDFIERFNEMPEIKLFKKDSVQPDYVKAIIGCRFHKQFVILKLAEVDDIEIALTFKGLDIKVSREEVHPLPAGEHYIFDLIGLDVFTQENARVGTITDVLLTGANDVYVIKPAPQFSNKKELLIPVIDDVVLEVDTKNRRVIVNLIEGLLD